MPPPPDPLDSLLARWQAAPPPPPVAPEVWRRLAAEEAAVAKPGWFARLAGDFARPAFALTFMAACALLGLFLAEVRLSRLQAERDRQLATSYLRLIDPLLAHDSNRGPSAPRS